MRRDSPFYSGGLPGEANHMWSYRVWAVSELHCFHQFKIAALDGGDRIAIRVATFKASLPNWCYNVLQTASDSPDTADVLHEPKFAAGTEQACNLANHLFLVFDAA